MRRGTKIHAAQYRIGHWPASQLVWPGARSHVTWRVEYAVHVGNPLSNLVTAAACRQLHLRQGPALGPSAMRWRAPNQRAASPPRSR